MTVNAHQLGLSCNITAAHENYAFRKISCARCVCVNAILSHNVQRLHEEKNEGEVSRRSSDYEDIEEPLEEHPDCEKPATQGASAIEPALPEARSELNSPSITLSQRACRCPNAYEKKSFITRNH